MSSDSHPGLHAPRPNPASAHRPTVLVTGASSGIGRATALEMAGRGWRVLAGVRRPIDGEALAQAAVAAGAAGQVEWLPLDLLRPGDIAAAADRVSVVTRGAGLDGLVNSAGVAFVAPLELLSLERLREQLEVNSVAPIALVQALAEPLRVARGRIVNVSSVSGRNVLPFLGPYCASKFALEALSDALRMELSPWGVRVIVVRPGKVATPMWDRARDGAERVWQGFAAADRERYQAVKRAIERLAGQGRMTSPEAVARVIAQALTSHRPRTRYVVGWDARLGIAFSHLPDRWRDWLVRRAIGGE
jgi:NAD(P)-dependent dehydrogenase (short-subunit alcohol dehydrogenase family)